MREDGSGSLRGGNSPGGFLSVLSRQERPEHL